MKQEFLNADPVHAAPPQTTQTAAPTLTAAQMTQNVTAALEQRRIHERRARLRKRVFAALTGTLFLSLCLNGFLLYEWSGFRRELIIANREVPAAPTAATVANAPLKAVVNAPLKLVKVSTLKQGQAAYADFDAITALAKGRKPSTTFVSLTLPATNQISVGNDTITNAPFWKIVKTEQGYSILAYASAGAALSLANGETADVYARPVNGGVETSIPLNRFAQDNLIQGTMTSENMELTLPPPDDNATP